MAVRVSQQMMFTNFVNNMNSSLTSLMDLNEQASSQKKVNKPSDAPVAASQILQYRTQISSLGQYSRNADIAKGWLNQADSTLLEVNTVLTRIRGLAEQASNGTMSKSNRDQVSYEVRELFEQLIVLSNTEYEGEHIFAGHKTEAPAFRETLAVTSNDPDASLNYGIEGDSDTTVLVQFLSSGAVGADSLNFRYSRDGGETWDQGTLAPGDNVLDLDGVLLTLESGSTVKAVDTEHPDISVHQNGDVNGTWLWVRPAAQYIGDFEDSVEVDKFGANAFNAQAKGFFQQDIMVRIDNKTSVTLSEEVTYSYSLDRGVTWVSDNAVTAGAGATSTTLPVPGGYLQLDTANPANQLNSGDQFVIRPQRANIYFEISPGERLSVNNIGKDVFGGVYYATPDASNATAAMGGSAENMFEVVGKLVGYIETNNQSGIQEALEALGSASEKILTAAANVGARENRLEVAMTTLTSLTDIKEGRLSQLEDVDVTELMTSLTQQQFVYQTVLKSSSMIMQMRLSDFI